MCVMKVKGVWYATPPRIYGVATRAAPAYQWVEDNPVLPPAVQSYVVGTRKMCELCPGRLKPAETPGEGRSGADVQIVRPTWV